MNEFRWPNCSTWPKIRFSTVLLLGTEILTKMSKTKTEMNRLTWVHARSQPMHPTTRCVSRRHRESMQGWGGTSGRSSKDGRRGLWMWSAASSLHGRVMTSTYATSLAKQRLNPSELGSGCSFRYFFDIFANISVPNKSKITKQRRPDSLRNSSWHKSEPAIWVVEHVCQCWHLQKLAWSLLINWQRLLHTLNIYTCIVSEINISSLLWCVRKS